MSSARQRKREYNRAYYRSKLAENSAYNSERRAKSLEKDPEHNKKRYLKDLKRDPDYLTKYRAQKVKEDPHYHKRTMLKHKYGLTLEEYRDMLNSQHGKCAICRHSSEKLVVDHCHSSNNIRALLCGPCNSGLGFFKENVYSLKEAIKYIIKYLPKEQK